MLEILPGLKKDEAGGTSRLLPFRKCFEGNISTLVPLLMEFQ